MEREVREHYEAIRTELKNSGAIEEMAASNSPLTQVWNSNGGFEWEGKDPNLAVDFPNNTVSYEFGKTVQWKIKEGRDFSRDFATDSSAVILNEAAAKLFGYTDPQKIIGKHFQQWGREGQVIGVVKDALQDIRWLMVLNVKGTKSTGVPSSITTPKLTTAELVATNIEFMMPNTK
jgi:hypothetical protein